MNHADYYVLFSSQTVLYFYGVRLVAVRYIDQPRKPEHSTDGFVDADGTRWGIVINEDEDPPNGEIGERQYAKVIIGGTVVKTLEIWDGPNGRVYHEVGQ